MHHLEKKAHRLKPVIEARQARFEAENNKLTFVRKKRLETVTHMRAKQKEYMDGVARLNAERGTENRLMLEALETGLDSIKMAWMNLYQAVVELEREEKHQSDIMSQAHRDLESIKTLQNKYKSSFAQELSRQEQKSLDEHALGKFSRQN